MTKQLHWLLRLMIAVHGDVETNAFVSAMKIHFKEQYTTGYVK